MSVLSLHLGPPQGGLGRWRWAGLSFLSCHPVAISPNSGQQTFIEGPNCIRHPTGQSKGDETAKMQTAGDSPSLPSGGQPEASLPFSFTDKGAPGLLSHAALHLFCDITPCDGAFLPLPRARTSTRQPPSPSQPSPTQSLKLFPPRNILSSRPLSSQQNHCLLPTSHVLFNPGPHRTVMTVRGLVCASAGTYKELNKY